MDFSGYLRRAIADCGTTQAAFSRAVGDSPAYISQVLSNTRPPPLDRLADWAAALQLTAPQAAQFIRLGRLAHSPPQVQSLVADLERQLDHLANLNATNATRLAHLESLMRQAGIPIDDPPSTPPSAKDAP